MSFKSIFILGILALSLTACERKQPSTNALNIHGLSLYDPQDVTLIEKGRLSKEERVLATKNLFRALRDNYVLWTLKKTTVKVDPTRIEKACIATEEAISGSTYRSDFLDRISACIASLKDTHLFIFPTLRRSTLVAPIGGIAEINGKIYVSSVRSALIDHAAESNPSLKNLAQDLVPGTEILYIDGKLSTLAIADFQKYMSGSTDLAARTTALLQFFQRNILYPKTPTLKVVIVTPQGIKKELRLPWYYAPSTDLETDVLLGERKFTDQQALGLSTTNMGFWPGDSIFKPDDFQTGHLIFYADEQKRDPFIEFGILKSEATKCYLKVSTFNLDSRSAFDENDLPLETASVIETLLKKCEAIDGELILDLWYNDGGDLKIAQDLLSALLPDDTNLKVLRSHRTGKNGWDLLNIYRLWANEDPSFKPQYELLRDGYINQQPVTDWFVRPVPTEVSGVFSGKITALISPHCISACDAIVRGLKDSQRAKFIGEPTNGTGAGFLSAARSNYVYFDPNNLFRVSIPNQVFNVTAHPTEEIVLPFTEVLLLEGKPTLPDVPYSLTLKDITQGFVDFKALLMQ